MDNNGNLSSKNLLALKLAAGASVRDAASALGIGERTAYRWHRDPAFKNRVRAFRSELLGFAAGKLANAMGKASDVLIAMLEDENKLVRFKAANKILEHGHRLTELSDLAERVAEIIADTEREKKR